jgi:5-oxoprolinase (ATP-hydrolysing) subunit A
MNIDINCDLGEGEPLELTEALMRHITSANIGSENTQACIALAKRYGVHVGAHPRHSIGRGEVRVSPAELETLLLEQVKPFVGLHHIKLHGALYHATDKDPALARAYATLVQRQWPGVIIYARCGGLVEQVAKSCGVPVWGEAFADRRYKADGTLVPRTEPDALITDVEAAVAQSQELIRRLKPQTLCVHSDTPNAPAIAEAIKRMVQGLRPSSRG